MADLFPADAVIRRLGAEPAALLGAGRALLLQVAHPSVAAGVADHSEFQSNPFKRLVGTLESTYAVVFGDTALADQVGGRVKRIHNHVTGPGYYANDPALLMWVHATLVDTARLCFERYVRPLGRREAEQFYEESKTVAEVFGCPIAAQPATLADFDDYFATTAAELQVSDVGRHLAHDIIWPALPIVPRAVRPVFKPPLSVFRLVSAGLLPDSLREQFGFTWEAKQQRNFRRAEKLASTGFRIAPRSIRTAPTRLQGRYLVKRAHKRFADTPLSKSSA